MKVEFQKQFIYRHCYILSTMRVYRNGPKKRQYLVSKSFLLRRTMSRESWQEISLQLDTRYDFSVFLLPMIFVVSL